MVQVLEQRGIETLGAETLGGRPSNLIVIETDRVDVPVAYLSGVDASTEGDPSILLMPEVNPAISDGLTAHRDIEPSNEILQDTLGAELSEAETARFGSEAGFGRLKTIIKVGSVLVAGVAAWTASSFFQNESGGTTPAGAASANKSAAVWLDTSKGPDCNVVVAEAGTAQTYEMDINGKKVLVKSDNGFAKPVKAHADQNSRYDTNSMHNPFTTGPAPEKLQTEFEATLCEDAPILASAVHLIGNTIYKGKRLADYKGGEWLQPIADKEVKDLSAVADYLLGSDISDSDITKHYDRYLVKQKLASNVIAVLRNLKNMGVKAGPTLEDYAYGIGSGSVSVGQTPEIVLTKEQFEKAFMLEFGAFKKGEDCPEFVLGVNDGVDVQGKDSDQRVEKPKPEVCVPDTTTKPGTPHTPGTPPNDTTPTTHPFYETTTVPGQTTTVPRETTTVPRETTTVPKKTGPKQGDHPPVTGGPDTTVETPISGGPEPTIHVNTTLPPATTETTIKANQPTPTTAPQGGTNRW